MMALLLSYAARSPERKDWPASGPIEEVVFYIINHAFHFAFGARAVRLMRFDAEAIVIGEVQKLRVQLLL